MMFLTTKFVASQEEVELKNYKYIACGEKTSVFLKKLVNFFCFFFLVQLLFRQHVAGRMKSACGAVHSLVSSDLK